MDEQVEITQADKITVEAGFDKKRVIQKIVEADRSSFDRWLAKRPSIISLDIPEDALRYVLISERLLELVDNPKDVQIVIDQKSDAKLVALVVERRAVAVSPLSIITQCAADVKRARDEGRYGDTRVIIERAKAAGLDPYHHKYSHLVERGALHQNDYVLNELDIEVTGLGNDSLRVERYWDREDMRRRGIATSFYLRLRNIAQQLGFRFITGFNNDGNISFFLDKLGRTRLGDIPAALHDDIYLAEGKTTYPNEITFECLKPSDKSVYSSSK